MKKENTANIKEKAFAIAKELGEDYISMLKEDFDGNLPEVLREYIAVNYPILSEDAEKVFEEALSVAKEIENDSWRAWALFGIASQLAKVDVERAMEVFEEALSVAREIENDSSRAEALRDIASDFAKVDAERAKNIFEEALSIAKGIEDDSTRALALFGIASELAKVDVERALSVAGKIGSGLLWRAALTKIAINLVVTDVKYALSIARKIDKKVDRVWALSSMASELSDIYEALSIFNEALSEAEEIKDKRDRGIALVYVAANLMDVDEYRALSIFDETLSIAKKIRNRSSKANLLSEIAEALSDHDSERALEIYEEAFSFATRIEVVVINTRDRKLVDITEGIAKINPNRALSIVREIEDKDYRASALFSIASELAKVDVDRALSLAREIEDDTWRARALSYIATELAKVDVERALSLAREIEDEDDRAEALSSIASELARQNTKKNLREMPDSLILSMLMEEWPAKQIKGTIRNYMEHGKDVSKIYSRYEEPKEYLKPFGIEKELPEMNYNPMEVWFSYYMENPANIKEKENSEEDVTYYLKKGSEYYAKANYKKALSLYERAIEIDPDFPEAWRYKADALLKLNRPIEAKKYYNIAVKLEHSDDMNKKLGITIRKAMDYEKALNYEKAAEFYEELEMWEDARRCKELMGMEESKKERSFISRADRTPELGTIDIHHLEEYEHPKKIGGGSFGRVYRAKRKGDGNTIAIKVVKRWDKRHSRQFIKEVSIWENLAEMDRKHIVNIFDYSATPFGYIEMEYMERSLNDLKFPLDPKVAAKYMLDVAYALYTAHSQKPPTIHMDIKPSNILINSEGNAKLGDWGIAGKMYKDIDLQGKGTLDFCSPEVLEPMQYGKVDEQSDIFSFGSTFYYILTGIKPFSGKTKEETVKNILSRDFVPERPSYYNSEIPEILDKLVMGCIEKGKERRYGRIIEIISSLSNYLNVPLDLSSGTRTNILADVVLVYAKDGLILKTKVAIEELLKKHVKSVKIKKDMEVLVQTLENMMNAHGESAGKHLKENTEVLKRIRMLCMEIKRGM